MMKFFSALLFLTLTTSALGAAPGDSLIIESHEFVPPSYFDGAEGFRNKEAYEGFVNWYQTEFQPRFVYTKMTYKVDGLKVIGFTITPRQSVSKKLPVIIYNRGGNGDWGKFAIDDIKGDLLTFLDAGFIVIGTQYRGNDGGEGKEEWGGADVNDVLALQSVIDHLSMADTRNVFMLGYSRGGMMAMLTSKAGMNLNAIATVGGAFDLLAPGNARMTPVFQEYIPGYALDPEKSLKERSAVYWPELIHSPVLLLQGSSDYSVNPIEPTTLAQKLTELGKPVEFSIISGGNHSIRWFPAKAERDRKILEWFTRYLIP